MSGAVQQLDRALEAMDRVLAARPRLDGYAFTDATQAVCAYRDDQRRRVRETAAGPEPRRRLKAANLAVTLLLAGHFPLGDMPWDQLQGLKDHLSAMRADEAAEATA